MLRSTPVCVAIYSTFARSALCTIVSGLSLSLVCVCGPLISQFLKDQRTHTKQTHTDQTQTTARREYQNVPNPPTSPNRLLPTPKTPPDYIFIAHPSRPKRTSSTLLLTSHQYPPIYLPYPIPATAHAPCRPHRHGGPNSPLMPHAAHAPLQRVPETLPPQRLASGRPPLRALALRQLCGRSVESRGTDPRTAPA